MLAYQRLDVYRCALRFVAISHAISEAIPNGYASLADQLRRSALSIPLNIAEGSGRTGDADAARFYAIARGSAMESGAILDVCEALQIGQTELRREAHGLAVRIVEMLTKMSR
jgi:four helix bundle protein